MQPITNPEILLMEKPGENLCLTDGNSEIDLSHCRPGIYLLDSNRRKLAGNKFLIRS
jgi:hypothetical protein